MKHAHSLRTMVAAMALLAVMVSTSYGQTKTEPGKIDIIGGTTYDWGNVAPGKLQATIEVKNVGQGDLNIKEVRPSCGCTAAPIDKNLLKPGEIGKISVTLNATTSVGQIHKSLTITSDDPIAPVLSIALQANIKKAYTFTPADYFSVLNGKVGVETVSLVNIVNVGEEAFTLYPPEFGDGNVKVRSEMTAERVLKPGEVQELKIYITPLKAGPIGGVVKVRTSSKENPTKDLDIVGSNVEDAPSQSSNGQ